MDRRVNHFLVNLGILKKEKDLINLNQNCATVQHEVLLSRL